MLKSNFRKLFGTPAYKSEEVESEGVSTRFLKADQIELWQLQPESPIAKFIDKKEGIHHTPCCGRYRVRDARLQKEGLSS
jgi:methylmalonyl-CoA/ethylmalonyl-CoA epimerase